MLENSTRTVDMEFEEEEFETPVVTVVNDCEKKEFISGVRQNSMDREKRKGVNTIAFLSVAIVIGLAFVVLTMLLVNHLTGKKEDYSYNEKKTIIHWEAKTGSIVYEKMIVNTETKEETFQTPNISVVHDFEKGLTVVKFAKDDLYTCYLTTLNPTGLIDPAEMESAVSSNQVPDLKHLPVRELAFHKTSVIVANKDFLSPQSRKLCEGITVHWMIPTGENEIHHNDHQKRTSSYLHLTIDEFTIQSAFIVK